MTRRDRNLLLIGTLALLLARLALSLLRSGPVLVADELGYLMNARVLAGGVAGQLQLAPFYHGGYSLPLAPLLALTSAPGLGYHLVLALNAVLAASIFPLLYVLLTRCAGIAPSLALGPAFAAALYPSVTILSQVAMSENLLFPLTCAWLIAASELIARPRRRAIGSAALTAGLAAFAYATHGRMVVLVALTGALLLWLGWRRALRPAAALAGGGVLVGGLLATHFLDAFLVNRNYGGHAASEAGARLSGLEHPGAVWGAFENLVGQGWSLLVASFGLAAIVGLAAARQLRSERGAGRSRTNPAGPLTVVLAIGLLVVSAASFPVRSRADMLIYGRYAEVVAPPLIALGLAWLRLAIPATGTPWRTRLRWPAAFAVVTVFVAAVQAAGGLAGANRWNVASFPFATSNLGAKVIVGAAIVAAAGAWALCRTSLRRPGASWLLAAVLFLPVTAYALRRPVFQAESAVYPSGWTSPGPAAAGIRVVAYDLDRAGAGGGYPTIGDLYLTQWFLPHTRLLLFHSRRARPPLRYVISDRGWGERHPVLHAVPVWASRGRAPSSLWRIARP
jgi:hypothetical protein